MSEENNQKDVRDVRDVRDMYRAFDSADYLVRKRYRADLGQYEVYPIPEWMKQMLPEVTDENGKRVGDNIQFFQIKKLVYDRAENITDKLVTVYHTMSVFPATGIIMLLNSDGTSTELYLGVAERFKETANQVDNRSRGNKLSALKTVFEANFAGSAINEDCEKSTRKREILENVFSDIQSVSCVTGIASMRDKNTKENNRFVQGIEKLVDAMRGKPFSAVFIADCKSIGDIESLCADYEDIYSQLSPFVESTQTVGTSGTVTDTESFIKGVTDTTNESVSDSVSKSHTTGTFSSDTVGGGINIKIVHVDAHHTEGKNDNDTDGTSHSTTTGSAKSLTEQNSVAKAISESTNNGLQITFKNRAVQTLMEKIDEQIRHLRACEAYGTFDYACYFMAEESSVSSTAASVYDSLMRGDDSATEVSAVNTWTDGKAREILAYLKRFYHPLIAVPNFARPVEDGKDIYYALPVTPSAIVSGREIALHMGLPKKSVSGIAVTSCAEFGRNVISKDVKRHAGEEKTIPLGCIYHMQQREEQVKVALNIQNLAAHTFITGSTGSGKSSTIYQMLDQLDQQDISFLVIEPAKGEYKRELKIKGIHLYGTNPGYAELLRINPFSFPEGIHVCEHMDRLIEIFNVCWPMYAAMPAVLKDAVERAYQDAGWNMETSVNKYNEKLFPTFADVLRQIDHVMNESKYSSDTKGDYIGALSTRLRSLTNGINRLVFTANELSAQELFDQKVIIDLSRVGSVETKSLVMGLLVMKLQEHRMTSAMGANQRLQHVTVLEEAHNLLKRTSTEQSTEGANLIGKSVEMLTNAIAEMRTYGEGFIIADQSPGLLDMSVIRNTNTKIILRLPDYSDRQLVGKAAGLNDEQIDELSRLERGVAAVYQNDWIESVLCAVEDYSGKNKDKESNIKVSACTPKCKNNNAPITKCDLLCSLAKERIPERLNFLDDSVIMADIPTSVKCDIFDYFHADDADKIKILCRTTYDLFDAESVFSQADQFSDHTKWSQFIYRELVPSVAELDEAQRKLILQMLALEDMQRRTDKEEFVYNLARKERL